MRRWLFAGQGFYLGDMFAEAAARYGDIPVILDRPLDVAPEAGTKHTYASLADLVDRLADRLATVGVRPGDRVVVHKDNNADIALLACAIARIGAVPALFSPALDPATVGTLLGRLEQPWLVTDSTKRPGLTGLLDLNKLTRGLVEMRLEPGHPGTPVTPVRLHPAEPALITHSSGTTDVPKLAVHCAAAMWNRLIPQKISALPLRGETAALCVSYVHSRFYHALGVFLSGGSPLLLLVDHDPASVGPLFAHWKPGVVETHPNTFVLWEELAEATGAPLSNVRCFGSTFDAIHPRTVQRLLGASNRRAPWLCQLYGQSETGPVAIRWLTRRGAARGNGRSVGTGIPGFTKIRVTDEAGRPCRPGHAGHIEVRTRGRILTYQGAAERYAAQLNGNWWRMGDLGRRSWFGGLRLVDREIDRIDSVESNLAVEDVLMSRLVELREVILLPGLSGSVVPVVCTKSGKPLDPARWRSATADLPGMDEPRQWDFDDLPRTATWKIQRVALTRMLVGERHV